MEPPFPSPFAEPPPPSRRLRQALPWLLKAAALALAVWLMVRLLAGLEWSDLAARLGRAHLGWLGAAVAALFVRFLVWDQRWRLAIAREGRLPRRRVTLTALLAAAAINTVTPTARVLGGVLRARYVGRNVGQSLGRAYGSVLFDQIAHQVVVGAVTLLSVIAAAFVAGRTGTGIVITAATGVAAAAGLLWLRLRSPGGERALLRRIARRAVGRAGEGSRLHRLVAHGREAVDVVTALLADRRLRLQVVVLGAAFFVVNAAGQWLVFLALGAEVSFTVVLAVVALGAAAGVAVGTPGGLGAAEATMIATFTAFGVDRLDAAAASLLYRALHFGSILVLGLPCLVVLELAIGRDDRRVRRGVPASAGEPVQDAPIEVEIGDDRRRDD